MMLFSSANLNSSSIPEPTLSIFVLRIIPECQNGTMPEFSHAFSGLAAKSKLSHSELVRSVRFMIAAEYEAIQLYEQLAESTDNEAARKVLLDIAREEMEHVGEFRRLLSVLAPQDEPFYLRGVKETEETLAEIGVPVPLCSSSGCMK